MGSKPVIRGRRRAFFHRKTQGIRAFCISGFQEFTTFVKFEKLDGCSLPIVRLLAGFSCRTGILSLALGIA